MRLRLQKNNKNRRAVTLLFLAVLVLLCGQILVVWHHEWKPAVLIDYFRSVSRPQLLFVDGQEKNSSSLTTVNAIADGCFHVFIDVGANIGVHARFLFEPQKYPNATIAHEIFDGQFGPAGSRDNRDVCVFAFEPNPTHQSRHLQLQQSYSKHGWRYHPIFAAAGDLAENVTFFHQDRGANNEWGFAAIPRGGRENTKEIISTVRLSSWLRDNIQGRLIPAIPKTKSFQVEKNRTMNTILNSPKVVMKFDVEGMEFSLFPDLLFSGVMCEVVDYAFGEIHPWKVVQTPANPSTGAGGLNLRPGRNTDLYWNNLMAAFSSLRHDFCKTQKIDIRDDESYLMDDQPLL